MAVAELNHEITRKGVAWTEDEVRRLVSMRSENKTVPEIAAALGRPLTATYAMARKHSEAVFVRKTYSEEEDAFLRQAAEDGLNNRQISERLDGRSTNSVRTRMRDLGVLELRRERMEARLAREREERQAARPAKPRRTRTPRVAVNAEQIAILTAEGKTLREIASTLKVTQKRIRQIADEADIALFRPEPVVRRKPVRQAKPAASDQARKARDAKDREKADELLKVNKIMTISQASRAVGSDLRTVKRIAAKFDISFRVDPRKDPDKPKKAAADKSKTKKAMSAKTAALSGKKETAARDTADETTAKADGPRLTDRQMAERLQLIRDIAIRMRAEGRLPPLK